MLPPDSFRPHFYMQVTVTIALNQPSLKGTVFGDFLGTSWGHGTHFFGGLFTIAPTLVGSWSCGHPVGR